jgi:hypothetical protein
VLRPSEERSPKLQTPKKNSQDRNTRNNQGKDPMKAQRAINKGKKRKKAEN